MNNTNVFIQIVQYLIGIFNQELVTVSVLDYTVLLTYAVVWFITDRLVVFVVCYSVVFAVILSIRGYYWPHRNGTAVWVLLCAVFVDFLVVMSVSFVLFISKDFHGVEFIQHLTNLESQNAVHFGYTHDFMYLVSGLHFSFKADVVSLIFMVLAFLTIDVCLFFYAEITSSPAAVACCFLLKASSVCAFTATNVFTLVVFMEISAVIVFLWIAGGRQGGRAISSLYYFIYSSVSGLIGFGCAAFLSGILHTNEFFLYELLTDIWGRSANPYVMPITLLLFLCFLIKVPVGPFYHWLLKAHVDANTSGSILLAGVLLKIPAVGLFRLVVSLQYTLPTVIGGLAVMLAFFSVVVGVSQWWSESDIKRIVALSSVVHMSGIVWVLMVADIESGPLISVSIITLLVSHSLLSCFLFSTVGMISSRYHTRNIFQISGLLRDAPRLAVSFFIGTILTGAVPVGLVFAAEAYTVSLFGLSNSTLAAVFWVAGYSVVFLKLFVVLVSVCRGQSSGNAVVCDMTAIEMAPILVFGVFAVSVAVLATSLTITLSVLGHIFHRPFTEYIVYTRAEFKRRKSRRGERLSFSGLQTTNRDWTIGFEPADVKKRRLVRFYWNCLTFRDKIGTFGRDTYSSARILPKKDMPWRSILNSLPEHVRQPSLASPSIFRWRVFGRDSGQAELRLAEARRRIQEMRHSRSVH